MQKKKREKKNSCARTRRPKSWPVPPTVSHFNLFIWHASTYARKQIHSHWKTSAEEEEGQVTYLLLLWRQPCIYFYSFHMHSPSSPFILSSLCREETHQLMFSFTVIGWFKAASVNCAPSQSPHCSSSTLCHPPPVLPPFSFTLALFASFLQNT